jgi:hypothetical protein
MASFETSSYFVDHLPIFNSVATDSAGNVYVAGYQSAYTYNYGNGVTVAGPSTGDNVVLVKYSSSGDAQWARSAVEGGTLALFNSVAVGGAGAVYAAGVQFGTRTYNYGNGATAAGTYSSDYNVVLVKYIE